MAEALTNWTYHSRNDAERVIGLQVRDTFLKCLDRSITDMEEDNVLPLALESRRAVLGKVRYDVALALKSPSDFVWDMVLDHNMAPETRFSIDFVEQSVSQSYANDVKDFNHRWSVLTASPSPLDIKRFLQILYTAQMRQAFAVPAQKKMFLFLEKALLEQLGFMFLELKTRFEELGVGGQEKAELQSVTATPEDEALFNSLCDFLKSWEPSAEMLEVIGNPNRMLTPQEVLTIVSNLQQLVPQMLEDALGYPDGRLAENIKESMLHHAEEVLGFPKGQISFSKDAEQAVEMVDRVFSENLYERKIHHASRTILAQILFPSVKAAMLNRRWFAQDDHPAREFISSVSEAVAPEDGNVQADMVDQAAQSVHRLVTGFNEDVSIFGVLTQEIQEYAEEKKEKEWEELVITREKIRGELRKMWSKIQAPQPVIDFGLELGGEHLAMLDRRGERNSSSWQMGLKTLNQLLATKSTLTSKVKIDGLLRDGLMDMLISCGWTGVRAHGRLAEQEDVIHAYYVLGQRDFPTITSFPLPPRPIRRRPKDASEEARNAEPSQLAVRELGEPSPPQTPHTTAAVAPVLEPSVSVSSPLPPSLSFEEQLAQLKIGDSVEWVNAQQEKVKVKLSYISPLSLKHLFVNDQGARVLVGNPKELVKMAENGRLLLSRPSPS